MKAVRKLAAAVLMTGLLVAATAETCLADTASVVGPVECTWYDLHIDATGLISWKMELPDDPISSNLEVQRYTVYLDIMTNGTWRTGYKKFITTETSKEINYPLVGIYKFRVTAAFVGGFVSNESQDSDWCTVTADYVNKGSGETTTGGPGTTSSGTQVGPAYAGSGVPSWVEKNGQWINNGGVWTYVNNGETYRNRWACIYNPYVNANSGQKSYDWFCFDANGIMRTGWYTDAQGCTYYLNPNSDGTKGKMVTGWKTIDGVTYYFNEKEGTGYMGAMVRNATVDGHVLDADGRMVR